MIVAELLVVLLLLDVFVGLLRIVAALAGLALELGVLLLRFVLWPAGRLGGRALWRALRTVSPTASARRGTRARAHVDAALYQHAYQHQESVLRGVEAALARGRA